MTLRAGGIRALINARLTVASVKASPWLVGANLPDRFTSV